MSNHNRFKIFGGQAKAKEVPPERLVLDAILATTPALYVNVASRPMIEIPFRSPPEEREAWPIDSDRVAAEIAYFAYSRSRPLVLRERQVSQMVRILKGHAWRNRRSPANLGEAFDEAPLIEALYTLLTEDLANKPFKGTVSELQKKLNAIAVRLGINHIEKAWPKGPAQFSKHLKDLSQQGVLAKFGITFLRLENDRPRNVELRYDPDADAAALAASEQRRDQNSSTSQNLRHRDAGDGATPSVFADLSAPPTIPREET